MNNFRKAMVMTLTFCLFVVGITACIVEPYFQSETFYYEDAKVRKDLSGQLNYLICGSSHAFRAFIPEILDEELGCNSYNLSCAMMTMQGRYAILKKEMDRNPINTVVLELSFNALTRNREREGPEGDIYMLARFDNFLERARYFISSIDIREYGKLYYDTLNRGFTCWNKILNGEKDNLVQYKTKGFVSKPSNDLSVTKEEYRENHYTGSLDTTVYEENIFY